MKQIYKESLAYHKNPPGKLSIQVTKKLQNQHELALAYSPGVAAPCLAITKNFSEAYQYTTKGNLVAVISNGTAVLGLGNIGALPSKPVMEGKAALFKVLANIDAYDIEINENNPESLIHIIKSISPTFGGINLEDIKAPECFVIEKALKEALNIPVMHDDQHGTAIIIGAGLLNALSLVNKDIKNIKVVINGAGAGAIACGKLLFSLGLPKKQLLMLDSKGVLNQERVDLNQYKSHFVQTTNARSLSDACKEADVFIGLSIGNVLKAEDLKAMANQPIVFALSNPDPEIAYDLAKKTRDDLIIGTGRSDFPNQINNVLGFPYIFRGALDVQATTINESMKLAAVQALAQLAKEPIPTNVLDIYGNRSLSFGKDYIIPKPIDSRLLPIVSTAVAKAAIKSGVARQSIQDWNEYKKSLMYNK